MVVVTCMPAAGAVIGGAAGEAWALVTPPPRGCTPAAWAPSVAAELPTGPGHPPTSPADADLDLFFCFCAGEASAGIAAAAPFWAAHEQAGGGAGRFLGMMRSVGSLGSTCAKQQGRV